MRVWAWNINGMKTKQMGEFLKKHKPDVLCLSETLMKLGEGVTGENLKAEGYKLYNNPGSTGSLAQEYAGTAMYTREEPRAVWKVKLQAGQKEGRVIRADFEKFIIITVYAPFSGGHGDWKA